MAKAKDGSELQVIETVDTVSRNPGDEWDWRGLLGQTDSAIVTREDRIAELEEQLDDAGKRERRYMDLISGEVSDAKENNRPPVAVTLERWEDKALRYRELQVSIQSELDQLRSGQ